jgi:hypothetical protein
MLDEMSSREYTEWLAFERMNGPIGDTWRDEVLAGIHELIQYQNHMFGQANFTDKKHPRNPVPKPERYVRPHEAYAKTKRAEDRKAARADDSE